MQWGEPSKEDFHSRAHIGGDSIWLESTCGINEEDAERIVKDLDASVKLDSIAITSIHHVGTRTRAALKKSH